MTIAEEIVDKLVLDLTRRGIAVPESELREPWCEIVREVFVSRSKDWTEQPRSK